MPAGAEAGAMVWRLAPATRLLPEWINHCTSYEKQYLTGMPQYQQINPLYFSINITKSIEKIYHPQTPVVTGILEIVM
jgi:hypothetical protein